MSTINGTECREIVIIYFLLRGAGSLANGPNSAQGPKKPKISWVGVHMSRSPHAPEYLPQHRLVPE